MSPDTLRFYFLFSLICILVYFILKWIFDTCFLWSSSSIFLSMFCLCWIDDLMFFLQCALGRGSWKWSVWPTILHLCLNTETERDEENCLYSHYSFCTMQQSSCFWAVLGSRFLKPSLSFSTRDISTRDISSRTSLHLRWSFFFIFETLAVASFAAVPALGCPWFTSWDLTRLWLTSLSLANSISSTSGVRHVQGGWREEGASILERWSTNVFNRASSPRLHSVLLCQLFHGHSGRSHVEASA